METIQTILVDKFELPLKSHINFISFHKFNEHNIYFGNQFALFSYSLLNHKLLLLNKKQGFVSNGITSIYQDREDNLWMTAHRGINKIKKSKFKNYYELNGLLENEVTAIGQLIQEL